MKKQDFKEHHHPRKNTTNKKQTWITERATWLLARQVVLSRAPAEKLKAIERNDHRATQALKREIYFTISKMDLRKLTSKQRATVHRRMDTIGRLPLSEFMEVENAIFGAGNKPPEKRDHNDKR